MRTPNCGDGAWVPIDYERYWQLFDKQFHFRAGVEADSWPAIAEPAGSMVFDLSPIFGRPPREAAIEMNYVDEAVVAALVNVLQPGERAVVLDWQHQSFSFDPRAVKPGVPDDLVVTPFPDGDYHAFLTPDMAAGTFGHPWERTLRVSATGLSTASPSRCRPGCPSAVTTAVELPSQQAAEARLHRQRARRWSVGTCERVTDTLGAGVVACRGQPRTSG